jgi:hypothetical protein
MQIYRVTVSLRNRAVQINILLRKKTRATRLYGYSFAFSDASMASGQNVYHESQ